MENGIVMRTKEGSPQGGNLSPLLANIYLDKFDKEFESRGVKVIRYADDIILLAKSIRAAERLLGTSTQYLSFCPDYGKLVFAVCLWLSSSTLRELGCNYHLCSFPLQSRETEISDCIDADCLALFGVYLEFQVLLKILRARSK